jgi:hypothetical protein
MRRFSFLIAAILLVGLFWGGVAELVDSLGIQAWWQSRIEASDNIPRTAITDQEQ